MKQTITSLEETVLSLLVSRESKHKKLLNAQINHAQVTNRQVSKIGFITTFTVPSSIIRLSTMSKRKVFEIYAEHPHSYAGAEFLLWFEHGLIKSLEGYVFIGQWPTAEHSFHFHTHHDSLSADLVKKQYPISRYMYK